MTADFLIVECRLRLRIGDWRRNPESTVSIDNRQSQSQSAIANLNRHSAISIPNPQSQNPQSPIANPQ
jgi:hypothetical protein